MTRTSGHGTGSTTTVSPGKEWWSRRPFSKTVSAGSSSTHLFKRWSHKKERRDALKEVRSELEQEPS